MSSGYQVNRKDIIKMLGPVEATPQCEGEAANFFRCMGANGDDDRKCMREMRMLQYCQLLRPKSDVVVKRSRRRSLVNSILSLSRKTSNTIKRL